MACCKASSVRLVVKEGAPTPTPQELESAEPIKIAPAKPRFEDAFVAMLGGQPKRTLDLKAARQAASKESAAVEAVDLTKKFGDFTAADHISFSVKRGEIFGLLGPNGAGKSTTFKMMCGLLRPTGGNGAGRRAIDLYRATAAARGRLGYMAQKFSLYGDLSVRQNLDFFGGVYGLWGAQKRERHRPRRRRLSISARILACNAGSCRSASSSGSRCPARSCTSPHVLFLDEPTSGVDPLTRREFWGYINAMVATRRDRDGDDPLHGRGRILRPRRPDLSRPEHRHRYAGRLAGPRADPELARIRRWKTRSSR